MLCVHVVNYSVCRAKRAFSLNTKQSNCIYTNLKQTVQMILQNFTLMEQLVAAFFTLCTVVCSRLTIKGHVTYSIIPFYGTCSKYSKVIRNATSGLFA